MTRSQATPSSSQIITMARMLEERNNVIDQLRADLEEQCRLNGMGSEREAALMAKL